MHTGGRKTLLPGPAVRSFRDRRVLFLAVCFLCAKCRTLGPGRCRPARSLPGRLQDMLDAGTVCGFGNAETGQHSSSVRSWLVEQGVLVRQTVLEQPGREQQAHLAGGVPRQDGRSLGRPGEARLREGGDI